MNTTHGTLLGGQIIYAQPATGFRSGLEPVLLAASIPARPGQTVLEAGSGPGAALLCLTARIPDITGEGWELDANLATLATQNADDNGYTGLTFKTADITTITGPPRFHHAMANPPYHPAGGTPPPDANTARAKQAPTDLINAWIAAMARALLPRGTITLIVGTPMVPHCLAAFSQHGCGSQAVLPLWPRQGQPARIALVRAIKSGRAPFRLLPGLALHQDEGFAPEAAAILRAPQPLSL